MAVGDRIEAARIDRAFHFSRNSIIKPQNQIRWPGRIPRGEHLMHSFAERCVKPDIAVPAHDESVHLQEGCRGQHILAAL
jgi:hypothetical protein